MSRLIKNKDRVGVACVSFVIGVIFWLSILYLLGLCECSHSDSFKPGQWIKHKTTYREGIIIKESGWGDIKDYKVRWHLSDYYDYVYAIEIKPYERDDEDEWDKL